MIRASQGRQPTLTLTSGVTMRPWRQEDAPELLIAMEDPLIRRYAGQLPEGRAEALELTRRFAHAWRGGSGAAWALADGSGNLVGGITFALIDGELAVGAVGYWLLPHLRGRGVVSAGVLASTRSVFDRLGWHRIELRHAVENERSCAVARRCGFTLEGVMREAMRYPVDGRWSDEHLHARLVSDPAPRGA